MMKMTKTMKMIRMLSTGLGTAERAKNEKEVSVQKNAAMCFLLCTAEGVGGCASLVLRSLTALR
jgi:hypothetical protein